ncbi:MAG: phenylalanine--tRNA ligase subunit beta [Proteobacteria bacterium]|nr:phenylalanine--tRNA ligase subunit beta [Pseudomonadota bacterium]MBU4009391.1 phenylalanine--tRNA ligase subunit beta [Pseudomonadota bacterium]
MKVSLSWLEDYVPIETDIYDLASALTMAGLEVESVDDTFNYLEKVVVGRIVEINPHPNADKLKLCRVDAGDRFLQIVCGAPNIKENLLVPLAMHGTLLTDGTLIEVCEVRGQRSEGMLCSEKELELGDDGSGVLVLSDDLRIGSRITGALGLSDYTLEIGLTPNRSDCLSVIGIAREIAAIQKTKIKYPIANEIDNNKTNNFISVIIEAVNHCPRYAAGLVKDITVSQSPFWLRKRLISVGQRPINNIVDISNFVMLECGQPLHTFDYDQVAEKRIIVRTATKGESFVTLDRKDRIMDEEMLLICDGKKPVAIAGVMGGLNSGIDSSTKQVLIESAYFNPLSIRKTSKRLGLSTESSYRFERGVDPDGTVRALIRASNLIAEIGKGKIYEGIVDEYPLKQNTDTIELSISKTNKLLGLELDKATIKTLLESIEFKVQNSGSDTIEIVPPSFRVDIARPVDLMEEAARLYGYNNIPTTLPLMQAEAVRPLKVLVLRENIRDIMTGLSFTEAINYSFINESACDLLKLSSDDPKRQLVKVLNPLTEEQNVMRTSLVPGLIETMRRNLSYQSKNLKIYEIGKIFLNKGKDSLAEEIEMIAGLLTGDRHSSAWYSKETNCDFYDIKGFVEALLAALNISNVTFTKLTFELCDYTRYGHTAKIVAGNETIGLVGEMDPEVLANFGLKQAAYIFELNCNILLKLSNLLKMSRQLPKFPSVTRDITIIINKDIEVMSIIDNINSIGEKLIENAHLFDIFEGAPIPPAKKSVSIRITYRSSEKTLEDDDVNNTHKSITDRLINKYGASLPA